MKQVIIALSLSCAAAAEVVTITAGQQSNPEQQRAEYAAWQAAEAAQMVQPADFPNGIAVPASGTNTPMMRIEATAQGDVVAYVAHASPFDPAAMESNRLAAISGRDTIRADLRGIRTNVAAAIDATAANIEEARAISVSTTSSTAQVRSAVIDMRRELIDANQLLRDALRAIQDLRKAQAQTLREAE